MLVGLADRAVRWLNSPLGERFDPSIIDRSLGQAKITAAVKNQPSASIRPWAVLGRDIEALGFVLGGAATWGRRRFNWAEMADRTGAIAVDNRSSGRIILAPSFQR
jgi:hypothetical protein